MAKIERKQTTVYKIELTKEEYDLIRTILCNVNGETKAEQNCIDDLAETFNEAWID